MSTTEPAVTRERILEEATRIFVSLGYRGMSMREIAEAVGVSKAGLYYHFKDKEDLFVAILTDNLRQVERLVDQAYREGRTARERVRLLMLSIFAQPATQRSLIRLASQEITHVSQAARDSFNQLYHHNFIARIEQMLQEGITSGELRAADSRQATLILMSMAYPFFYPLREGEQAQLDRAVELIVTIFFDGLALSASRQADR